jgi:hypothetical protein
MNQPGSKKGSSFTDNAKPYNITAKPPVILAGMRMICRRSYYSKGSTGVLVTHITHIIPKVPLVF